VVAIKLGSEGSIVFAPALEEPVGVPALSVPLVDPTGAGDAYCGAFALSYARTRDALEAALHATVAGGLTVGQCGALSILPFQSRVIEGHLEHLRSEIEHYAHGKPRAEVGQHAGGHQRPASVPA
jgi:ribokinase